VCKKLIKNSQPFGKKCQKTAGGDFFDSHCTSCYVKVNCTIGERQLTSTTFGTRALKLTVKTTLHRFNHVSIVCQCIA